MAEQEKNGWLGINGKKYGPVSEQDIKELYAQKKINGDTKFARAGATEWITLSQSGIITEMEEADEDGLPPLPPNDKTLPANNPTKKSRLGLIAAGLGVAVVISIAGLIFVVLHMSNNADASPNSYAAQDNRTDMTASTPKPTPTPTAEPKLAKEDIIGQWEWVGMDMVIFIGENGLLFSGVTGSDLAKGYYTIFQDNVICYWDDLPDQPIPLTYSDSDGCFYTESDSEKQQFIKKTTYNSMEGIWEGAFETPSTTFQFAADGSVSLTIDGKSGEGTYKVAGNLLVIKFEELGSFTWHYYPEIDLLYSTLDDGTNRYFQHISGDVTLTSKQSEADAQGLPVTEIFAQSAAPHIAYNGISIDHLLGSVDEVINALNGSPMRDEYKLRYDDIEFRHDGGNITSFELYDPDFLEVNGVTLGKNQTELIDKLGEPDADGETYSGYAMSYYLGGYSIFLEFGEADAAAWRVTVSKYDPSAAAENEQSHAVEEKALETEILSYVDQQKRLLVESYLSAIQSADEYYEQAKSMGDSYNMYYPVAMGLYETVMDSFKVQFYDSAGKLTDCTDTPEYAHCASRWRECKRIIGY